MNVLIIADILFWRGLMKINSININIEGYIDKYNLIKQNKQINIANDNKKNFDKILQKEIEKNKIRKF